ncbi:unnamed protein product [Orchesella dallaii]|uniref:Poly(A) polymerase n=1 Tax=Orchesella dallaii TaxID=48710 RepID=A0ABP1QIM5_9HEXA
MNNNYWQSTEGDKSQTGYLGVTSQISLAVPTPQDFNLTNGLEITLKSHGMFETVHERTHTTEILSKLDGLVKQWVREVSILKNIPPCSVDHFGAKICTFGSYKLGVYNKVADIDSLCVVPKHIERVEYFTSFYELLKGQPEVSDLRAVEEAFVPVIKMTFDGIEIDMTFARLALKEIPDDLELKDDNILRNLERKCVYSLNGCRVTELILSLVPNSQSFRLALRAIKLWAKSKGIYSNILGYIGGVSWAMLVARTCQLYPHAAASTIVHKFFLVFSTWPWPKPVILKMPNSSINLGFQNWDPRVNPSDRNHLMPIITPAYPHQNSTFNSSQSTRLVIMKELRRGLKVTEAIASNKATWEKLFDPLNFFSKYKHYIVIIAVSNSAEDQLKWQGHVESKLRHLTQNLERNRYIQLPHIWPNRFNAVKPNPGRHSTQWFIGLVFAKCGSLEIDLTTDFKNFGLMVKSEAERRKIYSDGMDLDAKYVHKKDLLKYVPAQEVA